MVTLRSTAVTDAARRRLGVAHNIRWLAAANFGVKPFWFIFLLFSARYLGPAEFGAYMFTFSFVSIVSAFFDGGVDLLAVRELSIHKEAFVDFFARSSVTRVGLSLAAGLAAIAIGYVFHFPIGTPVLLVTAVVYSVSNALMIHARFVFRAFEILQNEALSIVVEKGLVIAFGTFVLLRGARAEGFAISYAAAYFLSCLLTLGLMIKVVGLPRWRLTFLPSLWSTILRPALPFALLNIFTVVYFRSGTVMLGWLLGREDAVGEFNAGFRLVESYMLFPGIITAPLFARFSKPGESMEVLSALAANAFRGVIGLTICIAIPIFALQREVTELFFGPSFREASRVVGIIALAMIPVGASFVFGTLIAATGLQQRANRYIGLVTGLNILANFLLIPVFGTAGAAMVALGTETTLAFAYMWLARSKVSLEPLRALVLRSGILILSILGASLILPDSWGALLHLIVLGVISLVGVFLSGLLTVDDVRKIVGDFPRLHLTR